MAATVTVLIPARNEEADIERCLRAVLDQDHPHDRMEIVLVNGGSTDRTAEIASAVLAAGDIEWKIVDNPTGTTPSNLNAGLAVATGDLLCRVDARSIVSAHYVRTCASILESRPDVAVTGGAQVAIALLGTRKSVGIARALNNKYAMGGSRYRSGAPSGPSDTVYLGAFRRQQLRAAGGWDDHFATNQDYELNRRMHQHGLVWFQEGLEVSYVPRTTLAAIGSQYVRFGRWKVRYWRRTGDRPQPRQLVRIGSGLLALVAGVGGAVGVGSVSSRVRPLAAVGLAALPATALLVIDDRGSGGKPAPLGVRLVAGTTVLLVAVGWLRGIVGELARPTRTSA